MDFEMKLSYIYFFVSEEVFSYKMLIQVEGQEQDYIIFKEEYQNNGN